MDRSYQQMNGLSNPGQLTRMEELELRIKVLVEEIRFYSSKAADVMTVIEMNENNTFQKEAETRLEELHRCKEELRTLTQQQNAASRPFSPPNTSMNSISSVPSMSSQYSPQTMAPSSLSQPQVTSTQYSPPTSSVQPTPSISSQYSPPNTAMAAASISTSVQPSPPTQQEQHQYVSSHHQSTQKPQISRREAAIQAAEKRSRVHSIGDAIFMCSVFLEYLDLIACACVSKSWKSKIRRTPGWKRIVLNFDCTLTGHIGKITALATYDSFLVTGSADGKVKFWDPSKNFICVKTLNITPSPLQKYVHPKVKELRKASSSHGEASTHEEDEYAEYPLAVTSLLTVDRSVLIGAQDGRLLIWMAQATDKKEFEILIHKAAISCMILVDEFIFTASLDGTVAFIYRKAFPFVPAPYQTNTPISHADKAHDQGVTALAFAGNHLFSGSLDGKIYVWGPRETSKVLQFKRVLSYQRVSPGTSSPAVTVEHTDRITSMVGYHERLYTASWDGSIKLWNASTLELLKDVPVLPIGICWSLCLRRDHTHTLVGGVRDSDICIMDWETLEVLSSCEANRWAYKLDQHTHWVKVVLALPDGRIVSGSDDWSAKVWQIRGASYYSKPSSFLGLQPGPLTQEDIDILIAKVGKVIPNQQLQEQKAHHDRLLKDRLASMNAEQLAEHNMNFTRSAELWAKWRAERKLKEGMNTVPATPATPATPQIPVTPSQTNLVPSTVSLTSNSVSGTTTTSNHGVYVNPGNSQSEPNINGISNGEPTHVKIEPITHLSGSEPNSNFRMNSNNMSNNNSHNDSLMQIEPHPYSPPQQSQDSSSHHLINDNIVQVPADMKLELPPLENGTNNNYQPASSPPLKNDDTNDSDSSSDNENENENSDLQISNDEEEGEDNEFKRQKIS